MFNCFMLFAVYMLQRYELILKLPNFYASSQKNPNKFGFSFDLHYLSPLVKVFSLENKKKKTFSFCIFLAYLYLCSNFKIKR